MQNAVHQGKREKTILHMDGDAFFVGVEVAKDQRLKHLAVVTGQERGIVTALSYEAKALGVVRGMPIFKVKREHPSVIVLPGDYAAYAHYSNMMFDIVRRYADEVEEYSIDECFADLTGLPSTLKMTFVQIASRIKKEIEDELLLSVTIGLAPTKVLAKVASKWVKPNGLTVIHSTTALEYLEKTPIETVWGIGPKTAAFLKNKGVQTAKDFVSKDIAWIRRYCAKPYEIIWYELQSVPITRIDASRKTTYSSIQKTHSFHPLTNDPIFLFSQLSKNIEDACRKARRYNLVPKKIIIFLKTQNFQYVTRVIPLPTPSASPEILISMVRTYVDEMHNRREMYRATGVTLQDLSPLNFLQGNLFEESTDDIKKFESIHKQLDALHEKFGARLVYLGSTHNALQQKTMGTDSGDMERNLLFL